MAELQAPSIATVGVRVLPQLAGFQTRLTTGLTNPLKVAGIAAVAATAGAIAGLTSMSVAAAKAFYGVEESLAKIVGLVGVAEEQVDAWGESLGGLAAETAQGPGELADALFFVTSAGLRGSDAMETLEASAKAATAGLGSVKQVADAVTSAMNAYGPETLSAAEATDVLVATVREGKVEADAVAGSLGRVIPIAAELGVSFSNVGAALAAMTRLGLSAEESTTALRGIFNAILKPGAQAQKTLAEFGLSAAELRESLGEGEGLLDLLVMLKDRFGDNDEALARVFPRVRGLVGVLSLVGENVDQAQGIFARMADTTGDLDDAFNAIAETSGFQVKQAMAEIQTIMTELGADILPDVADAIRELLPLFKDGVVPVLTASIDAIAGFVFGIKEITAAFLSLPDSARDAALALGVIGAAFAALSLHPVIATIVGVTAGITALGAAARENESEVNQLVDDIISLGEVQPATLAEIIGKIPEKDLDRLKEAGITLFELREFLDQGLFGTPQGQNWFTQILQDAGLSGSDAVELVNSLEHLQNQYNDAAWAAKQWAEEQEQAARSARPDPIWGLAAAQAELADKMLITGRVSDRTRKAVASDWEDTRGFIEEATEAVDDFIEAQLKAADPAFNLASARRDLADAEEGLAETRADPEATGRDIDEALFDVLEAQAEYDAALGRFALNQRETVDRLDELARDTGLFFDDIYIETRDGLISLAELNMPDFSSLGLAIKDGILVGVDPLAEELADKIIQAAGRAKESAAQALGARSPSTVFANEIGLPIAQGIAMGIDQGASDIELALRNATGRKRGSLDGPAPGGGIHQEVHVHNPTTQNVERDIQRGAASARTLALLHGGALRG
jgi:TP901 family phage tail tape measure protein